MNKILPFLAALTISMQAAAGGGYGYGKGETTINHREDNRVIHNNSVTDRSTNLDNQQQQKQAQGQLQGQISANKNANNSSSSSGSSSYSNTVVNSDSGGNELHTTVGDTTSVSEGSQAGAESNSEISIDASDNYDYAAASASTIYAQLCQQGTSGQAKGGGFANINPDPVCQRLDLYNFWMGHYEFEKKKAYRCTHSQTKGLEKKVCSQLYTEQMAEAYTYAMKNLMEAQEMVDLDEYPAKVDNVAGRLLRPLGIITAIALGVF